MVFGAALRASPDKSGPFAGIVRFMHDWAWLVVLAGPLAVALLQWFRRRFGSPWAWEAIQKILDEFRDTAFDEMSHEPIDHHRVTLFKYCKTHWRSRLYKSYPFIETGWLIAVARSGHLTKQRIRRFRAPDEGDKCEGVAGLAWRQRDWLLVPSTSSDPLPTLTSESDESELAEYAERTGVDLQWVTGQVAKSRPIAYSYAAVAVRLKGQPWGVLVLDSRDPRPIDRNQLQKFKPYASLLTPLLERT